MAVNKGSLTLTQEGLSAVQKENPLKSGEERSWELREGSVKLEAWHGQTPK